ncbi:hypothetical protein GAPWKB11_1242 [Gilliamella apicola]|nr:hypothetical protein GAPWKB11_1242 [Gilliamella apicola]
MAFIVSSADFSLFVIKFLMAGNKLMAFYILFVKRHLSSILFIFLLHL